MIWFLERAARFNAERAGVAMLQEASAWLTDVAWRLEAGPQLAIDFNIAHGGGVFPLRLEFPELFPDTPPRIVSREGKRLSGHQYSATGELCLEYRPDNWDRGVTAAMMIESAHRLISGERKNGAQAEVPSAHRVSQGQKLRLTTLRFLGFQRVQAQLATLPPASVHQATFRERSVDGTYAAWLVDFGEGIASWTDQLVSIRSSPIPGVVAKVASLDGLDRKLDGEALEAVLRENNLDALWDRIQTDDSVLVLLLADDTTVRCVWLGGEPGARKFLFYRTIEVVDEEMRLPEAHSALASKTVGIVGAGSVGSKIAISLARSGVGRIRILDDDILFPGNLVRHDLDWRYVGQHKAVALQDRILEVAPGCIVETRQISLGGQEAAATVAVGVEGLGGCDLIIDATADARAFNYCAAAAVGHKKPMLWAEVFAGGIGGLIARCVPDIDPPPLSARRQISAWCDKHGVEWQGAPVDYTVTPEVGPPLIATDADVSIVAAHASRFALDVLLRPNASAYPSSVYLIGLSDEWLFKQPFDTLPITLTAESWTVLSDGDRAAVPEALTFLASIIEPTKDLADATDTAA